MTSSHLPVNSSHLPGDSGQLDGDYGRLAADSGQLTDEAASQLRQLVGPIADRRKVGRAEMSAAFVTLCTGRFLTSAQLAAILRRSSKGLRKRFLTPLVRDGRLRLRYPEATNRPDQAYTAIQADDETALVEESVPSV